MLPAVRQILAKTPDERCCQDGARDAFLTCKAGATFWPPQPHYAKARRSGLSKRLDVVANTELLDEGTVLFDVAVLDVLQETAALTDEHHEATTRVVVLLVHLQVLGQVADALGKNRDLHLRASGVAFALAEFFDELGSALLGDAEFVGHGISTFLQAAPQGQTAFVRSIRKDASALYALRSG